jgi:CTP synthase
MKTLAAGGMRFSGMSPDGGLVEMIELPNHPFFLATQFHPELKSRPTHPHPLFRAFVAAARDRRDRIGAGDPDRNSVTEGVPASG